VLVSGLNDHGQLGLGSVSHVDTPHLLPGIEDCIDVAAGNFHSVVVTKRGVYSFGKNRHGQLGLNSTSSQSTPQIIEEIDSGKAISAACGGEHTIVIDGDSQGGGAVWSMGLGLSGQLGHGSSSSELGDHLEPRPILSLQDLKGSVVKVCAGVHHSMALLDSGEVYVWGDGHSGQLAGGSMFDEATPARLDDLEGQSIRDIACGGSHSIFLNNFGQVYTCGLNTAGQLGVGFDQVTTATLQRVEGGPQGLTNEDVVQVEAGWQHSLVLTREGYVYSWGHGLCGQLGLGGFNDEWDPNEVFALYVPEGQKLQGISAGWEHSAAW